LHPDVEALRPYLERARDFSGWDFSALEVRHLGPPLPWDYERLAREQARGAASALDLGTGGGEVLARLRDALPPRTVATEEWAVNAPVAYRRLAPLGVDVVRCRSLALPFAGATFDLVLDRHEELSPGEIGRVLRPGGRVLTQQVGRSNWCELRRHVPRMSDFGDLFDEYTRGFAAAGLRVVLAEQHEFRAAFRSLGDLVYSLAAMPWTVPDFSLERDGEALLALEEECGTAEGLVLTEGRFVIVAVQPA
jgi:SAM-dependent methyltransferase